MKICDQCNQPKPEREFPYQSNKTCFACHRVNAQNWHKLPWTKTHKRKVTEEATRNRLMGIRRRLNSGPFTDNTAQKASNPNGETE